MRLGSRASIWIGVISSAALVLSCGRGGGLLAHLGSCDSYPDPATSDYVLPWPAGVERTVTQANCMPVSHYGSQRYAYDVVMPIGSTIIAARAGEVIDVVEDLENGTGCPEANLVRVRHADGTVAAYLHLDKDGALVNVGDNVAQGQHIANSGNTGCSTDPHLHFVVWKDGTRTDSVPVTFSNAGPNRRGLKSDTNYTPE